MKFEYYILNENSETQDIKSVIKHFKEILKLCKELEKINAIFGDKIDWEGDFKRLNCGDFDDLIDGYINRWSIIGDPKRQDSKNGKFVKAGAEGLKVVKQIKKLMGEIDKIALGKNKWQGHSWDGSESGTTDFKDFIEMNIEYWEDHLKNL